MIEIFHSSFSASISFLRLRAATAISGGALPAGTYFYSLFCDNEYVGTKKMILLY